MPLLLSAISCAFGVFRSIRISLAKATLISPRNATSGVDLVKVVS